MMKYSGKWVAVLLAVFTMAACASEPKNFEEELRQVYQAERGFFYIKVPPALLTLALKAADDNEMSEFFNNARQVGIISFGEGFHVSEYPEIVSNLEDMLRRYQYEDLISISDTDKRIIMKIKENNGRATELVAIVSEASSPVIALTLSGDIDIKTIVAMASDLNFNQFLEMRSMGN